MQSIGAAAFVTMALTATIAAADGAHVDFNRDVRPILSAHCFKCHGPDEKTREAGLRLDLRDAAVKQLDSGSVAVVAGMPEKSGVVRRVFSADKDDLMPPVAANKPLSDEQKRVLKQWIAEGARYEPHWAFVPPRQATLPLQEGGAHQLGSAGGLRHRPLPFRQPVDSFVAAQLAAAGTTMSPEADRYTLVRRATLDLIGLPPAIEEVDSFIADDSPDAYERLIDRLSAAPQYGERWARKWLDLARYADTNGYEKDRIRFMSPYRDWVIRALNADMPFDQFTIEQLAGDMLPGATLPQHVATGFHRNTMINEEGGIDPLEFRFYSMVDRVNTTATVWMGLTLGCAQCHTHKFDPITHEDYYRQMAFLNNADEPTIDVPDAEIERRRVAILAEVEALEAALPEKFPSADGLTGSAHLEQKFQAWLNVERQKTVAWTMLRPQKADSGIPTLTILPDGSIFASGDITKRDVYDLTLDTRGLNEITAIKLEAMPDARLPKEGPGKIYYEGPVGDFWLSEITCGAGKFKTASQSFAAGKNNAAAAIDGDSQTGWSINGGQGRTHWAVFQFDKPLAAVPSLELKLLFERYYAGAMGRFRIWATTDPEGGEARDLPADLEQLLLAPTDSYTHAQRKRLLMHFALAAPELAAEREKINKVRDSLPARPTTLVMQERLADPRTTKVHHRGEFLQAKETVSPALLATFASLTNEQPRDRLGYARWLASPANPLVGRVTMNRQWAAMFGTGIVRTAEDFGYQGEPPSDQKLLDWLAVEFVRRGWSIKAMQRLIMTSSVYRQTAAVEFTALEGSPIESAPRSPLTAAHSIDPNNRLLWHFPRQRLEAEMVRDLLLATSGQLSRKIGGPSVFPPQPAGITTEGAYGPLTWTVSAGEDRYRRGLYTFAKRTTPYAMFATFDGPSGEACIARREVTNTPLQALTMLNDAVIIEAAQALARDMVKDPRSVPARITSLFRQCLTRPPTSDETKSLITFYDTQHQRLISKELDAEKIIGATAGSSVELAAWTLLARAIVNLDEMIVKE